MPRMRSQPYSLVKQHMFLPAFADASAGKSVTRHSLGDGGSFPRRVFAPGFCFLGFAHPNEGWRSAEITLGCSAPVGRALTRHARRLARRLASLGDARLSALHRGDFGLRSRTSLTGNSP